MNMKQTNKQTAYRESPLRHAGYSVLQLQLAVHENAQAGSLLIVVHASRILVDPISKSAVFDEH